MEVKPFGVFDSGFGGLTVLEELSEAFPHERFIYLGDTLRVPYGNKSHEEILTYSSQISRWLLNQDVKAIIVACNTVSCIALDELKTMFDVPFFGMVGAGVDAVFDFQRKNGRKLRLGIIGTKNTISSSMHENKLRELGFEGEIFAEACPLFVPVIEEGVTSEKIWETVIEYHLDSLKTKAPDVLLLACTHYPILTEYLSKFFGDDTVILNPNTYLCSNVSGVFGQMITANNTELGKVELHVTGSARSFEEFSRRFFNFGNDTVDVVDVSTL